MANSDNTGVPLQPLPDTSGLRVAILIPIHNGLSYTQKTLSWLEQSLKLAKSHPNIIAEVIVIDDGSTDGSGEFIRKQHPHIHLLEGPGNLWWSGAINMGAR
ncbi:MAG TPA: glycosyltransferase family 2 protein, partial [Magnetococcales bacterium]|nr:glycosyltransferase family 2 protein [Magnetococcales bacterium]